MKIFWKELWKKIIPNFWSLSTADNQIDILETDDLLRRVRFTDPNYIRPDLTITSFAFTPRKINGVPENGISVDISRLTTYDRAIVDRLSFRLYAVKVSSVRAIGLDCQCDPIDQNEAHALIVGDLNKSACRLLAKHAFRINFP